MESTEYTAILKQHRNPFTLNLLAKVHKAQNDAMARGEGKADENNWHTLTNKEQYILRIFNVYTKLDHVIEQLNHVTIFLNRFSSNKQFENNEITELTYIQYHLEVYFHKVHTVLELMKIIVNRVLQFGLKDKHCTWDNLKKSQGFTGSDIEGIMDEFLTAFRSIIDLRHFNTHRGFFEDTEIDHFSTPLFIYSQSKKYGMDMSGYKDTFPEFLLKYGMRRLRRKRSKELAKNNDILYSFMNAFYTEINIAFEHNLKTF